MRCPEDVAVPTEQNPVISGASSGHLSKEEAGRGTQIAVYVSEAGAYA